MADLAVTIDGREYEARWTDDNPATRAAIADAIPVEGDATRWGEELYFSIPVDEPLENGQERVPTGAIAYWPQGNALCLFWGPTPASQGDKPRAASPVAVVGMLESIDGLSDIDGGAHVLLRNG